MFGAHADGHRTVRAGHRRQRRAADVQHPGRARPPGTRFIGGLPMNAGDERVGRAVVDVVGRPDLLHLTVRHHAQPVAQRHRLHLIVGDVDRRHRKLAVQALEVAADLVAQLRIEIRQRLVEQERLRLAHQRTPHRHPLPLPTRELTGLAVEKLRRSPAARPSHGPGGRSRRAGFGAAGARRRGCGTPSCADRARSSGTPSRCHAGPAPAG